MTNLIALMCLASSLVLVGCHKKDKPVAFAPMQVNGINVDVPKLENALSTASPETRTVAMNVRYQFRYQNFAAAMENLEKLAADPSLTEDQKKVVGEVTEQVKQLIAQAPPR